jgi:hypothetical protein
VQVHDISWHGRTGLHHRAYELSHVARHRGVRKREVASLISGLALASFAAGPTSAQESDSSVARTTLEFCDRAKASKGRATTRSQKIENIVALQSCRDDGVRLLREYWQTGGDDKDVMNTLGSVSARLNDRRLYDAARSVLLDTHRAEDTRLAALSVLVAGYDPSLAVDFPAVTKPMYTSYVALGHTSYHPSRPASQPVGSYAKRDLFAVLDGLAASESNERIRKVGQELGPLLKKREELKSAGSFQQQSEPVPTVQMSSSRLGLLAADRLVQGEEPCLYSGRGSRRAVP